MPRVNNVNISNIINSNNNNISVTININSVNISCTININNVNSLINIICIKNLITNLTKFKYIYAT